MAFSRTLTTPVGAILLFLFHIISRRSRSSLSKCDAAAMSNSPIFLSAPRKNNKQEAVDALINFQRQRGIHYDEVQKQERYQSSFQRRQTSVRRQCVVAVLGIFLTAAAFIMGRLRSEEISL